MYTIQTAQKFVHGRDSCMQHGLAYHSGFALQHRISYGNSTIQIGRRHIISAALPKRQLKKAEQQLMFTLAGLNQALEELEGEHTDVESSENSSSLAAREDALWRRQQELWDRDSARWEAERQAWAAREASLLVENAALRRQMLQLLTSLSGSLPAAAAAPAESVAAAAPSAAGAQASGGAAAAEPGSAASSASRSADGPVQAGGSQPPQVQPSSVEEVESRSAGAAQEEAMPAWAAQLHAAMKAVDETDVLKDDLDYIALGEQFGQRTDQGAAFDDASAGSRAVHSPASDVSPAEPAEVPEDTAYWAAVQSAMSSDKDAADPETKDLADAAHPRGPPPVLVMGVDDIFWVNQLHAGLVRAGYYAGEDEMEEWIFGEGTQSALLTFQACAGIQESGVVDEDTWQALLGPAMQPILPDDGLESGSVPSAEASASAGVSSTETAPAASAPGWAGLFETAASISESPSTTTTSVAASATVYTKWPLARLDDGGRDVHQLHVALQLNGYYCTEDECRWWQFGDATDSALRAFQETSGLAPTGVSDAGTWHMLLGADATPADAYALEANDETDEDLSEPGERMWMIGEQRWSQPVLSKSLRP